MAAMFELRCATAPAWLEAVLANFDAFLVDHAACERKASATGMAFVARYPDRTEILDSLIEFAREELDHFHQVYRLCAARGLRLLGDEKDPYVTELLGWARSGREARLVDRLLVAGVVEARGCERFGLIASALEEPVLKTFYLDITRSEARHHGLFLRLARHYAPADELGARLGELLDLEAQVMSGLPIRAALH